ncbi:MAG: hypothetical protein IPL88_14750 [Rhizobiales bacterium]|nr:hypothetical protein [Hyphomicrobiales bacterium]
MRPALRLASIAAFAIAFGTAAPARADRIDGDWCDGAGRRIEIQGSTILTPGGAKASGDYGRHSFSYDAPAGEAPAGRIDFRQLNDDVMHETTAVGADGKPRVWKRCRTIS